MPYKDPEKERERQKKYSKTAKGKAASRRRQKKYQATEKGKSYIKKWKGSEKGIKSNRKASSKYSKTEKGKARTRKHNKSEKGKARTRRYDKSEKGKAKRRRFEKSEKRQEYKENWKTENPELVKSYSKKYYEKNPQADSKEMTKYRRSHKVCEWSGCIRTKSLHVHHILPKFNYPKYVDGDYHGKIGSNFICFCPLHHYAYHSLSAKKDAKHKKSLSMLWSQVIKWADKNKIPIEDIIAELDPFNKS